MPTVHGLVQLAPTCRPCLRGNVNHVKYFVFMMQRLEDPLLFGHGSTLLRETKLLLAGHDEMTWRPEPFCAESRFRHMAYAIPHENMGFCVLGQSKTVVMGSAYRSGVALSISAQSGVRPGVERYAHFAGH